MTEKKEIAKVEKGEENEKSEAPKFKSPKTAEYEYLKLKEPPVDFMKAIFEERAKAPPPWLAVTKELGKGEYSKPIVIEVKEEVKEEKKEEVI